MIKYVNTLMSLDGFIIISMILKHYGLAYLSSWLWWLTLI